MSISMYDCFSLNSCIHSTSMYMPTLNKGELGTGSTIVNRQRWTLPQSFIVKTGNPHPNVLANVSSHTAMGKLKFEGLCALGHQTTSFS